ncbi:molybdenum cofactor sulfurase [Xylariaceae sp. FL0016]|nr:molybdenum cofactor sulfurase [Xylariaceae sp. FL0016]
MTDEENRAYNDRIEALRQDEFPMLHDEVYLDHAGTTLYPRSLVEKFAADMTSNLFGNPHSASSSSQTSTSRIEDVRLRMLQFFNADPSEFDLVFVANATAGIKLVSEAFRSLPNGFKYLYHQACHTSLVGVRQEAKNSLCLSDDILNKWLDGTSPLADTGAQSEPILFAYPAQSNLDGKRYPMEWSGILRDRESTMPQSVYTLLDAAALATTSPLDLSSSETAPDFTVFSFYKMFGFPDLGGLLVRRQAVHAFRHRRYFGGGTVDMVSCIKEQWHAPKTQSLHTALEDGTLPIHSIIALDSALDIHANLFVSMKHVSSHTTFLTRRLFNGLRKLQHGNGEAVCTIYSSISNVTHDRPGVGPVVAFNLRNQAGAWVSLTEFEKLASLKKFHVRTGGLCNPGGIVCALGLEPWEMKQNFSAGFRCGNENDIMSGKPTGVIRVSMGAMSTISDADKFISFIDEFYRSQIKHMPTSQKELQVQQESSDLHVEAIMIYPIKSCGGFRVPKEVPWEVRPEGLAWDREWCLIHRGTGQALSQKRHPRMALIRPVIDFISGQMRVSCQLSGGVLHEMQVPLSANPNVFHKKEAFGLVASRVCGEEISAQIYKSSEVNDFFSDFLGVPCALARFPPGGHGTSMRHAKAHLQRHQKSSFTAHQIHNPQLPGLSTPPDSDSESEKSRILLSNESPILAISLPSLDALNREILQRGGLPVSAEVFRANIVMGSSTLESESLAYSEDHWSRLHIGTQKFKMLGACRRCHMVCINQSTAAKSEEPFVTLAKTRRFDGKVFFGTHMCHVPGPFLNSDAIAEAPHVQFPTIKIGDQVLVDPTPDKW